MADQTEHLTAAQVAAYLDRDLSDSARIQVEEHLESCASCRAELNASFDLAQSWKSAGAATTAIPRNKRWKIAAFSIPVGLAAAAAMWIVVPHSQTRKEGADSVRTNEFSEGRSAIEVIRPDGNSEVSPSNASFVWHRSKASVYRLTILTQSGVPVFTTDTQDTTVVLPDSVALTHGQNYFWRVDGIDNGIASTTGVVVLRISQ